jgi:uncharacterized DUF497 family protein
MIVWDEPKRLANIDAHGLDFTDAEAFDWENALVVPTYPSRHGRERFKALGLFGNMVVAIVYSPLGTEAISIVSMRPASERERRLFDGA